MKPSIRRKLDNGKRRIQRRLDKTDLRGCSEPIMTASNLHYEIADRTRGIASGGIGLMHALARRLGLIDALDRRLELLKIHLPYHESDHVLALAYLPLCGGTCLQDLELLRHDEVLLDALGARRLPDPTTAGDFCRRFSPDGIQTLLDVINDTRLKVWADQPPTFFEQARLDMDGFLVETTGQCKRGMDIGYDGTWGYHACVLTLANTGEVLSIVNRPGNRPSHEGAATLVDQATAVCFRGGFRRVLPRGDTKFSQSEHLDRWDDDPRVRFRQRRGNELPVLRLDGEAPLGQGWGSGQPFRNGAELGLRQGDATLVRPGDPADYRVNLSPRHGRGPQQDQRDRREQRTAPVPLQDAPAPLNRVVLAMVGRQVHQFDRHRVAVDELHHPLHELRPTTGDLRTVVEFDVQSPDAGVGRLTLGPPLFEAVGDEVAGLARMSEEEPRLVDRPLAATCLQHSQRDQRGLGRHVVVERLHRLGPACPAAAAEFADFDFRLGIEGDPQRFRVARGPGPGGVDVGEDRVGLGNFFSGRALRTRRSR